MEAIVLAAGLGSRMSMITTKRPKPMLPLGSKSILGHCLDRLKQVGVTRVVIVTHYLGDVIERELSPPAGMEVVYAAQVTPRGTGDAVATGARHVKGDALVLMGDSLVSVSTLEKLATGTGFLVAAAEVDDPSKYGVLEVDGPLVSHLVEKPKQPKSKLANAGFYRVPKAYLDASAALEPSPRGELEFTDVLGQAISKGELQWVEATDWIDVGTPWGYLDVHQAHFTQFVPGKWLASPAELKEAGVTLGDGAEVYLEPGATIKPHVHIEGQVVIRRGATVGPHAYLRGPVLVSKGCKVGAFTEVKASILLEGAKAPHHNYVGDSILGHDANLGSGTKLANIRHDGKNVKVTWKEKRVDTGRRKLGSILGDGAKTTINASLMPGTVLGPNENA